MGILLFLTACKSNENLSTNSTDTLTYNYDSLIKISSITAKNYLDIEDTTAAKIIFPKFKSDILNESIHKQLLGVFGPEEPAKSISELASNFIEGYERFRTEIPERPQTWYLNIKAKVLFQNPKYLSLEVRSEEYAGGAHGNLFIKYLNYDPKTYAPLILDDFLLPNSTPKLIQIAEKKFRENEGLTPNQSLENYFFEDAKFSLPANYRLTEEGLEFLYNNYEIKPYSDGITILVLPYASIMDLLKSKFKINNKN